MISKMFKEAAHRKIDLIRHSNKQKGGLSPEGVENSKKKGAELFEEIIASEPGTIFYFYSSPVPRAVQTKEILESTIQALALEKGAPIIFINDDGRDKFDVSDSNKWYVVIFSEPDPKLDYGFIEDSVSSDIGFENCRLTLGAKYKSDIVSRVWVAWPHEMSLLREQIKKDYPDITDEEIDRLKPKEFEPPEKAAIQQLEGIRSSLEAMEKDFPSKRLRGVYIMHAPRIDYVLLGMMGREISLESINQLGGFRDFLEGCSFEWDDEKLIIVYRNESIESKLTFEDAIKFLTIQMEKRQAAWATS